MIKEGPSDVVPKETPTTAQSETSPKIQRETPKEDEIVVDPAFLEYLRSLKPAPEKYVSSATETSFAEHVIFDSLRIYFSEHLQGLDMDTVRQNFKKYAANGLPVHTLYTFDPSNLSEESIKQALRNLAFEVFGRNYNEDVFIPKDGEVIDENDKITVRKPERADFDREMDSILEKYLAGNKVVDLGAGYEKFRIAADIHHAKEYVALDDPFGNGEEKIVEAKDRQRMEGYNKFWSNIFNIPNEPCRRRRISADILESLYTKIPKDSSCFVIFAVDEVYGLSNEYIAEANKLIAERTKVGGVVISGNSTIGLSLPKNFKLIHEGLVTVYLRES
ncbi:MAG: hypothetical protein PHC53_00585 [Patescibacteria group bacterium]|nr:hypothetical protein [Patescibacteria group bacterium]